MAQQKMSQTAKPSKYSLS